MITDRMLCEACAELNDAMLTSLPAPEACNPQFSRSFEQKMKRLIRRVNHPVRHRFMQRAAGLLLVMLLGFGMVMACSSSARASFAEWVREYTGYYFTYTLPDTDGAGDAEGEYYISKLPAGYELFFFSDENGLTSYIYVNEENRMLQFIYSHGDNGAFFLEGERQTITSVSISGHTGDLYIESDPAKNNALIWYDGNAQIIFCLIGNFTGEELVAMAESVLRK